MANDKNMEAAIAKANAAAAAAAAAASPAPAPVSPLGLVPQGPPLGVFAPMPPAPLVPAPLPRWEQVSANEDNPDGAMEPGRINLKRVAMWRLEVPGGWLYQERMTFASVVRGQTRTFERVSYGRGKPLFVPRTPADPDEVMAKMRSTAAAIAAEMRGDRDDDEAKPEAV